MPAEFIFRAQSNEFDPRLLDQLTCPVCFGTLQLASAGSELSCTQCLRSYPIVDGIPVLIPNRATDPAIASNKTAR